MRRTRNQSITRARWALVAALTIGAVVAPVTTAGATRGSCPERELAQTFGPFLDPIWYFPLPAGDFESGPGQWSLRGGARISAGSNQTMLDLPGAGIDDHALLLPPGATARAATVCVEGTAPVMRFFARPTGLLGALVVTVTATDDAGRTQVVSSPVLPLLPWWSAPMAVFRLPWLGDHLTQVTVEFRSIGLSPVLVDDIHVDPLRQR